MYQPAADSDIPAIVELMNRAYPGSRNPSGWSAQEAYLAGDRTTESLLRSDIAAKPSAALLKWIDGPAEPLTGCVWLEPIDNDTWYLGSLAIDPDRQNAGLGRTLLEAAERWVRQQGASRVRMSVVNVREPLIAWYIRRGYTNTGKTAPFPYHDERYGTPLRDDLCFTILEKTL